VIKNRSDFAERERVMQEAQHPNKLRMLLTVAGLNQREVARESGIPEGTLRHYVAGEQVIPRRDRVKLAQVIGCDIQDLAPQYGIQGDVPKKFASKYTMTDERIKGVSSFEEWDGCFSFGRLKTTSMVLDGDGTEAYLSANIRTHYDPQPATFFDEVMQAKRQIEQEEKQKNGELWNSQKYHLSKIVIGRESLHENMTLSLWLKPRDHYTGLATRRCLDNPDFRVKYLPEDWDWNSPITGFSCSMGVDMTVISSDGCALLTQRGQNQSVHQGMFNCSVSEAVSPLLDRSTTGQAPDLYRCASRGFAEELGLQEAVDFSASDILFLSFTVDTQYALYGLRGMVKVNKSAEEILQNWHAGVKDKRENSKIFAVPFTPQEVCSFVFSHEPFAPGGLVCLYHALVHEFGREQVNSAISSYL
jgi:transcriptional regulator with XRE-family HTH domain